MKAEVIYDVVKKLIGEVEPTADSHWDRERYENMKSFIEVFNRMHEVIDDVATRHKDSPFASAKAIGELASRRIESMGIE